MKKEISTYISNNKERFILELFDFLRIPSVSSDSLCEDEMIKAASYVKFHLLTAGADFAKVEKTDGHPVVFAEKFISHELPTVLIYGHYDVQPADPIELWDSPPFEPIIRNNKIYARGACDDKGQLFMHIKSLEFLTASDNLNCNLKYLFEGEEEIGSVSLEKYILENKDKLKSDVVLISDTAMINNETPSIIYSLKGIAYFDITVTGPSKDLHSGINGGTVANPVNVLCEMIGKLKDENNKITIPGFYDDIITPSEKDRTYIKQIDFDLEKYKSEFGLIETSGEAGFNTLEQISFRPTLDVNGIWGGHTGQGAKTIIPSKAHAKISMRLVPGQSAKNVIDSFMQYFKSIAPSSVSIEINTIASCESALTPTDSIAFKAAEIAISETFGKKPIPIRIGGSIPVVSMFEKLLNINSVLMGFGLDSDNIHGPNEHFGVYNFLKGIETIPIFIKHYGALHQKNIEQLKNEEINY